MGNRGDQFNGDNAAGTPATNADVERQQARSNLSLAAAETPQVWSRNDGGRYFDVAQAQPGDRTQSRTIETPTIGGNVIRITPDTGMIDILNPQGRPLGRGRLNQNEPTEVTIDGKKVYVNPNLTIDVPTSQNTFDRTYPGGTKLESYEKVGNNWQLKEAKYPDGGYEKYVNGKLRETSHNGFVTKFDEAGRKTDVSTPQGDKYSFKYGANGKVDSYEVTKKVGNENQVVEKGSRGADGNLKIERRQQDGSMKVDERFKGRTDVAIRTDLKLDYLDKDGYGLPDAAGRMIKRDDRTTFASARGADGREVPYPVNPIRSVRMADGRQIDYEYNSDKNRGQGQQGGADNITSYTVRDRSGKVVEFAQKIPDIPGTQRKNNTGWFEYKAPPGQGLPEDQIANVKRLMAPADQSKMGTQQGQAEVQKQMLANRTELMNTAPMKDFMPNQKGRETVDVAIDQVTGKQYNLYANGETRVRNERGQEFIQTRDQRTGDVFEKYGDGTTFRRAWDADPRKHPLDRTTVTVPNADGVPRVELHHSRKDNSFIDVNYDKDGKVPTEVIITPPGGTPIRMAPDAANPNSWMEYKREGNEWKPTGRAFPMKIDLINNQSNQTIEGRKLPAGTVVISQGDKRRVITPAGEEIMGKVGQAPTDIVPEKVFLTPQRPAQPGDEPQQTQPRRRGGPNGVEPPQEAPQRGPQRRLPNGQLPGGVRR